MESDTATSPPMPWLDGLNPAQHEAVCHLAGPLLVLSGAGTGKTRVLTARIVNLVRRGGVAPWEILAVTFTNKAAREMRERVERMIGAEARDIWFGTFHGLAARILRRHAESAGLNRNFTILDDDDCVRLMRQLMEARGIDTKAVAPRGVLECISRWKDRALTPDKAPPAGHGSIGDDEFRELYREYQARLQSLNACDFGDLLVHNINIFTAHPDILKEYHGRLKHFLVDEYQDTNTAQYLWLRLLAQSSRNIACVGDEDQSIYGWRGAEIENMLRFGEIYEDAKTVRLEENYRSTGHILAGAAAVIANNQSRLGKTLFTTGGAGEKIRITGHWDGPREARAIAGRIASLTRAGEVHPDDIAVLVRAGFLSREFEEAFIKSHIPYRVVGAKFYERQEIRDAVAYLRVIAQPADDLAFMRIVNTPRRGIGTTTIGAVRDYANKAGVPMLRAAELLAGDEAAPGAGAALKPAARRSLAPLVELFARWQEEAGRISHVALAALVLEESGYMGHWRGQKTADAPGRVENLGELVNAMDAFGSLAEFLEHIALVMDGDDADSDGEVTLMTLHAAKGLEFDTVFLTGWEDGIFPSQRTIDEKGGSGLEEERRLAYVGMTRARRRLQISWAASRLVHGKWQRGMASRFIGELPGDAITEDNEEGIAPLMAVADVTPFMQAGGGDGGDGGARHNGGAVVYAIGDRVHHDKFGNGNVIDVDGDKLTVIFDKADEKKLMADFVQLVRRGSDA